MRLFLIGATGYIGTVVAEYLQSDGHELVGLARSQEAADQLRAAGIEPVRGELGDVDVIAEQARATDGTVVVSTGGFILQALLNQEPLLTTTDALIEALSGTGKPLVMTWGIAMWMDTGWIFPDRVVTEEDPASWAYFYAHFAEAQRRLHAAGDDLRYIGIVPGGVYGRGGGYIGGITRFFDCIRKHGKMYAVAPGDNAASHVHVDDLAQLYARALRSPDTRGYFIASSEIVTTMDVAKAVSEAAGLGGEVELVDHRALRELCGRFMEWDFWSNLRGSGQKAMDELGWRPTHRSVVEELRSLPRPLDLSSVYPAPSRRKAAVAASSLNQNESPSKS
ncbi:NAD-dependent epimerase/dehydratase family protein [Streptomyces coelicoflavus]|uniref:NAD-dependent epimerase/dehydratase family protein n=1 Tax=Streptomyces coelicoflavus TaxID=285562 RepID=UPI00369167D8